MNGVCQITIAYDPIANRQSSLTYNEQGEEQLTTYQANNLNQYISRTTPGYAAVRDSDSAIITMSYDHMGRRRTKNGKSFYYNDYLQIADSDGNRYVWDPTEPAATRPLAWMHGDTISYYTHDGNKNISEVLSANGDIAAHYEYAPFGAAILQSGDLADANPWRFSSEYAEDDKATVYYNYRHYEPVMGRWFTRDPMEEVGGINLYVICENNVVDE